MNLPLGETTIEVDLDGCDVTVAEPPGGEPIDPREAAKRALSSPLGPPLSWRVSPGDRIAIVVTDVTRATPDGMLVELLLDELLEAGVSRGDVTIIVGLGLHRPLSGDELVELLGDNADLAVNHDPDGVVEVGRIDGIPIEIHPAVARADLVLSTGMVEPHQYAGFSGGAKTVVIGAGGEAAIRYTHGPAMLGRKGVRLGRIAANPFREFLDRAGDLVGPDFCLNVTQGPDGIFGVAAGQHRPVVHKLAEHALRVLSVPISSDYDAVVAGVGAPKDANLYQATRAATYVALGNCNPLRPGGRLVVPAELSEGAGQGRGEQRFYERLRDADSADALYREMRAGYEPGAQRAFVLARVLCEHDVYVTNSQHPEVVEECLMTARDRVEDAIDPGSTVLVVPDALNTLLIGS